MERKRRGGPEAAQDVATALKAAPRLTEPRPDTTTGSPDLQGHYSAVPLPRVVIPEGPSARDVKVAVILDVFSSTAFAYEWNQIEFGRTTGGRCSNASGPRCCSASRPGTATRAAGRR